LEEPRQGAVREELAARLAARAVVAFVLGVDDALHGGVAYGTGLAVAPVDRHAVAKGSDFLRETLAGFGAQDVRPAAKRRARRLEEPPRFLGGERARELQR